MPWTDILLASLAGGAVLFVWGAICWMALPHHHGDFKAFPKADEDRLTDTLASLHPTAGTYAVPHYANYAGMNDPALNERYLRGPNASVVVTPPGPCMQASVFVKGFLLDVVGAFAAAVVFHFASPQIPGAVRQVLFFAGVGALVHGFPGLSQVVWLKAPLRNALTMTFDGVVGFVLLALTFRFVM